jgi:D-serine deaminase-like pyridoxal phosphate-dependent protein
VYAIPWHICPTTALHNEVHLVEEGRVVESLTVLARARRVNH